MDQRAIGITLMLIGLLSLVFAAATLPGAEKSAHYQWVLFFIAIAIVVILAKRRYE